MYNAFLVLFKAKRNRKKKKINEGVKNAYDNKMWTKNNEKKKKNIREMQVRPTLPAIYICKHFLKNEKR